MHKDKECKDKCEMGMFKGCCCFGWHHMCLVKVSTAAFVLMLAKFFPMLMMLDWYWYLAIAVLAAIIPMKKWMCR